MFNPTLHSILVWKQKLKLSTNRINTKLEEDNIQEQKREKEKKFQKKLIRIILYLIRRENP